MFADHKHTLSDCFFNFNSFDQEITKKLSSLSGGTDALMVAFLDMLHRTALSHREIEKIKHLYKYLAELPLDNVYTGYLTHPIRVTASYIRLLNVVTFNDVVLGLCHNIKEVGFLSVLENRFISPPVRYCIDLLTIDRSLETEDWYLNTFYDNIVLCSENLLLLKAFDKLDNALGWVKVDIGHQDVRVVLDFVCPRLALAYPQLENYLRRLICYVANEEAKSKFKKI